MKLNPIQLAGPGTQSSGYFYEDILAIYQGKDANGNWTGQPADPQNSLDYVVKDASGNPLYINYNVPFQFCADPTNRNWLARYTEWGFSQSRGGYAMMFSDDVNFRIDTIANAQGVQTAPMLNGQPATDDTWEAAVVAFMADVHSIWRVAFPKMKLIHNTPWWLADPADWPNADYLMKEGGFLDLGLTGGAGMWSLDALFRYCDQVHKAGKGVHVLETLGGHTAQDQQYSLACSLLMTNGGDLWEDRILSAPANAFADLGDPIANRVRMANGLWCRPFTGGMVFALEPGASPLTAGLLSLQPRQGVILS